MNAPLQDDEYGQKYNDHDNDREESRSLDTRDLLRRKKLKTLPFNDSDSGAKLSTSIGNSRPFGANGSLAAMDRKDSDG